MPENTDPQKQYDHRLRRLIQNTEDLNLAVRHGVPRSTARGWLKQTRTDVVSIDVLDMDAEALHLFVGVESVPSDTGQLADAAAK